MTSLPGEKNGRWKGGISRFWSFVAIGGVDDCWEWQGYINQDGYGHISIERKMHRAHRVADELTHGPIPPGTHVRHSCDNRACCNPNHLLRGTNADNVADRVARGRTRPGCSRGEANTNAKLTNDKVKQIRAMYAQGSTTLAQLSEQFGVSFQTISKVIHHKRWAHV